MKALILSEPGDLKLTTVADPTPATGEVLLQVRMVGLCGTDLSSYRGKNPLVSYPRIMGHEISATVAEVHDANSTLRPGMDVTLSPYFNCGKCPACLRNRPNACQHNQTLGVQRDGALTDWLTVPAAKVYPAKLSLRELTLVEPLTIGFHATARGRITADDTVAIFGCGGVGLGAIAASAFRGANVIAMDMDDAKLAIAQTAGARHLINTAKVDLHTTLLDLTNGRGPDVIIEAIGLPTTFRAAVDEVASTGRVVYIGYAKEPVAYETRLFVQKELDILGSRNALPEDFRQVITMLEAGHFPVDAAISAIVPPTDAPKFLAEWSANPAAFTKILVNIN